MSDSVRPHRRQPTRLLRRWDSPGKNTGVGCHFLLQAMKVKSESEVIQSCPDSLQPHGLQPARLLRPWDLLGKSTGVGCHCLLQLTGLQVHNQRKSGEEKKTFFSFLSRCHMLPSSAPAPGWAGEIPCPYMVKVGL